MIPWIVLGMAANAVGWAREEYAYNRTGRFTEPDGAGPTRAPLRRMTTTTGEKILTLTFDDGPSEYTPGVLRVLAEHDVPATFFVLGERATAMPHVVRAVAQAGHEVASHGWSHTAFTELDSESLSSEIRRTQDKIREATGCESRDVRPPYGRYDGQVVSWLADLDLVTWLWTAEARDYDPGASVDQIVRNTLLSLTPGGIILLHDGGGDRSKTVQALPRIIDGARDRGFRFVALRDVRVPSRPMGYQRQP
jgi:peptidoglycan/xylan/chitin deacetylase (PgdA/CDA1 family)